MKSKRRVTVTKKILEESIEVETVPMKKRRRGVDDWLRILFSGFILLLNIDQKPLEVIHGHDAILRVFLEKGLDITRRLRCGVPEPPVKAETHSVRLLRHEGEKEEMDPLETKTMKASQNNLVQLWYLMKCTLHVNQFLEQIFNLSCRNDLCRHGYGRLWALLGLWIITAHKIELFFWVLLHVIFIGPMNKLGPLHEFLGFLLHLKE